MNIDSLTCIAIAIARHQRYYLTPALALALAPTAAANAALAPTLAQILTPGEL